MKLYFKKYEKFGGCFYRPDCEASKAICQVFSKKTVPVEKLEILRNGGFEIILRE